MRVQAWFSHLPPVLVLELSRFKYNQKSGQAEKIHDAFTFDRQLFMDRCAHVCVCVCVFVYDHMGTVIWENFVVKIFS